MCYTRLSNKQQAINFTNTLLHLIFLKFIRAKNVCKKVAKNKKTPFAKLQKNSAQTEGNVYLGAGFTPCDWLKHNHNSHFLLV
jgi:hypothetical protein